MRSFDAVPVVMWSITIVGIAFLIAPLLMIFPLSIDSRALIQFPPQDFTLKWYAAYLGSADWIGSTLLSLLVGLGASAIATTLGTLAGIGLVRGTFSYKRVIALILIAPLMLPLVVIAIAIYGIYSALGLVGSPVGLALAHGVLGIPLVIITVAAALSAVPKSYDEAAQSLGASSLVSLFTVTLPLIWRGIAAGAVFAFVASFDEVIIAIFLTGTTSITLPRRMIDGIFFDLSPILAAVSGCLVVFNVILALLGWWFASKPNRWTAPAHPGEAAP